MSKKGVWQLQRLIVNYCDIGGSSIGTRAILNDKLIKFATENPQINFVTFIRRGKHPHLRAEYKSGRMHAISVKNMSPEDVMRKMYDLRNQFGDKAKKIGSAKLTKRESVQGRWNPLLFMNVGPSSPSL